MTIIEANKAPSFQYLNAFKRVANALYPDVSAVDLNTAKLYARIDGNVEDTLVAAMVKAATNIAQTYTWLQFIAGEFEAVTDRFTELIYITKNPTREVLSIEYYDTENNLQTLPASDYTFGVVNGLGVIKMKKKIETFDRLDAVKLRVVCGFGGVSDVPEEAKIATMLILGHLYENRQDVVVGHSVNQIPMASQYILDGLKVKTI